ncbi:MAG: hypothetical protein GYA57_15410 [Myxococcales bacterium]|nr:hypothetical protein [Myxococcales bacterium]
MMTHLRRPDPLREALERAAAAVGLEVRRERLEIGDANAPGGLCRLADGRPVCILSDRLSDDEELRTLGLALLHFDLESVYLPPAARAYVERLSAEMPAKPAGGRTGGG